MNRKRSLPLIVFAVMLWPSLGVCSDLEERRSAFVALYEAASRVIEKQQDIVAVRDGCAACGMESRAFETGYRSWQERDAAYYANARKVVSVEFAVKVLGAAGFATFTDEEKKALPSYATVITKERYDKALAAFNAGDDAKKKQQCDGYEKALANPDSDWMTKGRPNFRLFERVGIDVTNPSEYTLQQLKDLFKDFKRDKNFMGN